MTSRTDDLHNVDIPPPARKPTRRLTLIWVVPLIALLIGVVLAAQAILAQGPEITLTFTQAEGLEVNKTRIKYKDVDLGIVKSISLSDDHRLVIVTARLDKQAESLMVDGSRFWVVRPRVAAGNISGLGTLLSGAYIAVDPGTSTEKRREFRGLDEVPLVTSDTPGKPFLLVAQDLGSLDISSPVYFRRIQVGRVVSYAMREDGKGVDVRVFIDAPYDKFVVAGSRFWHASGIDFSFDANGASLNTQSLVSLALGGVAFSTPETALNGEEVQAAAPHYTLYRNQAAAQHTPEAVIEKFVLHFRESVRGLTVGAPIDFRGITVGEVTHIDFAQDQKTTDFAIAVDIDLYPQRLTRRGKGGKPGRPTPKVTHQALDQMVAKGLRAQLQTGNLLTGQRFIGLDFFPNASNGQINWQAAIPELPTQPGVLDSLQQQLEKTVKVLQSTLVSADKLLVRVDGELVPELSRTLQDARKTLDKANQVLADDSPLQGRVDDTLREVSLAARSVRHLADLLERQPEALLMGKKDQK